MECAVAYGGVAEWLKAHAWKVCIPETVSRVRIPLPPLFAMEAKYFTRFPSFSWPSRLCSHEGEVVGEELSGHWIDKASKVACLGRLGGEHLREFADGGFHGASDPPQAGERVGIAGIGHVRAEQRLEIDVVGRRLGL